MISELSNRQIQLLKAIINEYLESSSPVGSQTIVKKYEINCSAATVRNDMADLLQKGFLEMLHTSSGRVPSTLAYRVFLTNLMEEEELPVLQEVAIKQRLWQHRFSFEKMLRQATVSLSDITKELAVATTNDGYVTHAGAVNILDYPEFWDINVARAALQLLDRYELLEKLFENAHFSEDVACLIGDEIGINELSTCSVVFSKYDNGANQGYVAVLGPARMNYASVYPAIRYTKAQIQELGGNW